MQYLRVNNRIRVPKVQLIDENGKQVGVVETYKALDMARERNLDLVEVSPKIWPPVCKIMDYGKYQYDKAKKERQKKIKKVEVKGVRIGLRTSKHDLEFKAVQADKFLQKGQKVKIDLRLRGREKAMGDLARERIGEFLNILQEPHKIEQEPKKFPTGITMVIAHE